MFHHYSMIEAKTAGLVVLRYGGGGVRDSSRVAPWTAGVQRVTRNCAGCHLPIQKGERAFRPSTGAFYRAERLCPQCVIRLANRLLRSKQ